MHSIYIKKGREESIYRHHPWIFSGSVHHVEGEPQDGDVVRVLDSEKKCLGVGHFGTGSIIVRMLDFADREIDESFWRERIAMARNLRMRLGLIDNASTTAYRLVHGEGDSLPGLVVDVYGTTAVVQAHSAGMHKSRMHIADALIDVMEGRIANVYYKSEGTLPRNYRQGGGKEDVLRPQIDGLLRGNTVKGICKENGLEFDVDWQRGQKTGFFVDQRFNRQLVERFACNNSVLNMFCYTGGFSVYALRGGATLVHSVDSSERAIEQTNRNVELNFGDCNRHESFCQDGFKFLESKDRIYDVVILDPPAFAKHRGALHQALKGYTRLNALGMQHVKKGGLLFTFSCSQVVTKEHFRNAVLAAAVQAGRNVSIMAQLHQPEDHPISIFHPEGEYLKGLLLSVD